MASSTHDANAPSVAHDVAPVPSGAPSRSARPDAPDFICPLCTRSFFRKSSLEQHIEAAHKTTQPSSSSSAASAPKATAAAKTSDHSNSARAKKNNASKIPADKLRQPPNAGRPQQPSRHTSAGRRSQDIPAHSNTPTQITAIDQAKKQEDAHTAENEVGQALSMPQALGLTSAPELRESNDSDSLRTSQQTRNQKRRARKAAKTAKATAASSAPTTATSPLASESTLTPTAPKHSHASQVANSHTSNSGPNSAENRTATAHRIAQNILNSKKPAAEKRSKSTAAASVPATASSDEKRAKSGPRSPLPPIQTQTDRVRQSHRQFEYPAHLSLEKAREEVAAGRAWEGILRANPNASRMCFLTVPGRAKDLLIKDEWLNRAFPGDTVIVQMLTEEDLKMEDAFQIARNTRKDRRNGSNNKKSDSSTTEKRGQNDENTGAKKDLNGDAQSSTSTKPSSESDAPNAQTRLTSHQLKGVESDSSDEEATHDQHAHHSSDDDSTTSDSDESSDESSQDEAAIKMAEVELALLNMTTHATFSSAGFDGPADEAKPKSELAKVVCITNPYHAKIGFVGQMRQRGGHYELRPLAVQYPIFDVPKPAAEYLDLILPEEPKTNGKRKRDRGKNKDKPEAGSIFITYFSSWSPKASHPIGTQVQLIGAAGDVEAECRAITSAHRIDTTPHPPALSAEFGKGTTIAITEEDLRTRKDLRTTRIFTVDPPTARDIDDALSIEKLSEKRYRVGVHIADVSHYVKPESPLDKVAQERSTSVYMVQTMYPMLPPALSENLCSLNPKVDRYAFSVMWDLDDEGNIIGNEWIGRSIIRSCVKLSYIEAQKCIECAAAGDLTPAVEHLASLSPEQKPSDIAQDIVYLNALAQQMRERRFRTGALKLSRLRLSFTLGPDGLPLEAHPYLIKESNQLIEEFMLLANMSVAKFIYKAFPQCALLRSHPQPKDDMMTEFNHLMKALSIKFDTSNSGAIYESLLKLEPWQQLPVEEMVARAMNAAIYVSTGQIANEEELWHYALNVPFYTHFTSPIRRYPDIIVHRQIQAALDKRDGKIYETVDKMIGGDPCHNSEWVSKMAEHSNERKKSARKAQDDSIKLFTCLFLRQKPFVDDEAIVLEISRNRITAFSPNLCVRAKVDIPSSRKGYQIRFDSQTRVLSVHDQSKNACVLSATYLSKVSMTFFTKGTLPMDIGAELTFWYTPPKPSQDDAKKEETNSSRSQAAPSSNNAPSRSESEGASAARNRRRPNNRKPKPLKKEE